VRFSNGFPLISPPLEASPLPSHGVRDLFVIFEGLSAISRVLVVIRFFRVSAVTSKIH
jgi:hypothetical protein